MAEMTISLRRDPATGKKNIIVTLQSDADALPHEHEQLHRALVNRLIEGGLLAASEVGKIVVEREEEESRPVAPPEPEQGRRQARPQGH